MKAKNPLTDPHIKSLIKECEQIVKNIGLIDFNTDNNFEDLNYYEGETSHTFGTFFPPDDEYSNCKIVLNKHLFNEPDDVIKNTILHELAHYINYRDLLDEGLFYWNTSGTKLYIESGFKYKSHGEEWKAIANKISNATGLDIKRTDSYNNHTEVGKHRDSKIKYIVTCTNCGLELPFERRTQFVKDPNRLSSDGKGYYWRCGRCGAKGKWKVTEK